MNIKERLIQKKNELTESAVSVQVYSPKRVAHSFVSLLFKALVRSYICVSAFWIILPQLLLITEGLLVKQSL